MERLADKLIVAACCCMALLFVEPSTGMVVAGLLAITATALYEALHDRVRSCAVFPVMFAASCVFFPAFAVFLPFSAYDCLREKGWARQSTRTLQPEEAHPPEQARPQEQAQRPGWMSLAAWMLRLGWLLALPFAFAWWPAQGFAAICISCALACLLSWRTSTILKEREESIRMRDDLQEASLAIEAKNRDLQASQDMQVRLAMLSERGRIAREIHDNVGHLLTRAIMQVEALQVVHADDPRTRADFCDVSNTLHEAMDEVRSSVHDLRDESLDIRGQLQDALDGCGIERVHLDYQVGDAPANVGYCLLAVTREALSNTVRHSDATSVEVTAIEHPGLYQLSIRDNGSKPPARIGGNGMGLATMEGRVRALGGTFRAQYQDGFLVFASIPKATSKAEGAQAAGKAEGAQAADKGWE